MAAENADGPGIRRVGVVGCGQMGGGIAQVCALAGYDTLVREVSAELAERGIAGIRKRLDRLVEKDELSATNRDAALSRLRATTALEEMADREIVIEAVVEDIEVKNEMWRALDAICPPVTIFASNTSSLTIAGMAAATQRPDRLVGLHFFNPVPVMKLVEVVRSIATDEDVYEAAFEFARALGKEPIACRDNSGFVVNLLLVPYLMDAIRAVDAGVASIDDIDTAMRLGTGHPMGPLTLCDFVGNDTLDRIGDVMFAEYREKRYASPPLLKRMVALGYHGRKAGKGFYDYAEDPPVPISLAF